MRIDGPIVVGGMTDEQIDAAVADAAERARACPDDGHLHLTRIRATPAPAPSGMRWGRILAVFVVAFAVVLAVASRSDARVLEPFGHRRVVAPIVARRTPPPVAVPGPVDFFGVTGTCFTTDDVLVVRYDSLRFAGLSWGPLQDDGRYGLQVRAGDWYDVAGVVPGGEHVLRYSEVGVKGGGWFAHGANAVRLVRTDGTGRSSAAFPIGYGTVC